MLGVAQSVKDFSIAMSFDEESLQVPFEFAAENNRLAARSNSFRLPIDDTNSSILKDAGSFRHHTKKFLVDPKATPRLEEANANPCNRTADTNQIP